MTFPTERALKSFLVRVKAAELALNRGTVPSIPNGEETSIPSLIASFTKGLRHLATGEVASSADFAQFVSAVNSGDEAEIAPCRSARTVTLVLASPSGGLPSPPASTSRCAGGSPWPLA